jgi:hypothetical protein
LRMLFSPSRFRRKSKWEIIFQSEFVQIYRQKKHKIKSKLIKWIPKRLER